MSSNSDLRQAKDKQRFYAFTSLLEMDCGNDDEKNNLCGTLTQIWLPIGKVSSLTIKMIFFFQLLVCIWACVGAGNMFFVSFESSEFLVCHINYLKRKIMKIFESDSENTRKKELAFCVRYHNWIIELGNDLNYLIKMTLGHMSLTAAVVMGMIANQIVQKYKPLGAGIYLGGYVIAIFWLSHAGQRVTDESLSIADAVFESDWYKSSKQMRKDLAFIIKRSHEPLRINALPLGTFNYALFITMLKASYSYLTLLQQSVSTQ
ncbi:odorant receptor Or2-like [Diabrotica undecimpunctata]|uniref:odorant receptor Or2-like n=1 Tax=Diabrotica undecimpunctata TaxID=50387 RepID=UPI003B639D81